MSKRKLVLVTALWGLVGLGFGQAPERQGELKELFKGPADVSGYSHWLKNLIAWRKAERNRLQYHDSVYLRPELKWRKKSFIYAQVMAQDRYLYDPVSRKYTVDHYLRDVENRYGGLDIVLIWPTYPNMGIDNRNQFDWLADMPGGLEGVHGMIADFHKSGVRVFFPIMFWDGGTRDIGLPMPVALIKEMKEIGADGLNGDTMFGVTADFLKASDSLHYPLIFQPEVGISDLKMVEWNQMSWGYYWKYEYIPGVSVYKWLEPRHQVQITNRWIINKTDDLQYAFFNGVGFNAWENIWGIWNQIPERYAEAIRRLAAIYRQFPRIWNTAGWQPHYPTLQRGIFASAFPGPDQTVYTLVNRDGTDKNGGQLQLPFKPGWSYFDLYNGKVLVPRRTGRNILLSFPMESNGFGAVLARRSDGQDRSFMTFISKMETMSKKPLKDFSVQWIPLLQQMINTGTTKAYQSPPEGMLAIPAVRNFKFESKGVMIEGDELPEGVGVQHPWQTHPSRSQEHFMDIPAFYIDQYPVTNRAFKKFLDATRYEPADKHNFLKDWSNGDYPAGWDDKPVTWVSIEDARAYAAWAGKRLPHEWEWQYAAQGSERFIYPWGNIMDSIRIPTPDTSRNSRPPYSVDAFPSGASPFGVMDMVGNIWQWTDEYVDNHTRSAILKGGSYYHPQTAFWYFPQALELNQYGKYLLLSPSADRAGTIGFRCVAGAQ
jgi:formylglycine-generating enzyme required for sulfatase activity